MASWRTIAVGLAAVAMVAAGCGPKKIALQRERELRGAGSSVAAGAAGNAVGAQPEAQGAGGVTATTAAGPASPSGAATGTGAATAGSTRTSGPAAAGAPTGGAAAGQPASAASIGSTEGVTDTSIKIGIHAPLTLSGVNVEPILKFKAISNAYWSAVNDAGGINGRKVDVDIEDDGYDPGTALQACRNMIAKKVFFISGTAGADQVAACGQYAIKQGLPYTSLGVTEAGLIGQPGYYAFTLSYEQQGDLQAKYIVHKLGGDTKPAALIRFNSANADGAHTHFDNTYRALTNKSPAVDDAVDKNGNNQELTSECLKMQQAGVQIVSVLTAPTVFSDLANACSGQNYHPQYVGWGNTDGCPVDPQNLGTPNLDGCVSFQTGHQPAQFKTAVGDQCRAAWAKYEQSNDGDMPKQPPGEQTCAYFDLIREALARTGKDLGRDAFKRTLSGFAYDNGLLNPINFGGSQMGSHAVVITKADANSKQEVEIDSTWSTTY